MEKNDIIDKEQKQIKKNYQLLYRILSSISFIYIIYCFSRYYFIKENLDSPFLPTYASGLMFSQQALQGFVVSIALFIAQLFNWNRMNLIAIIISGGGLILAQYINLFLFLISGE